MLVKAPAGLLRRWFEGKVSPTRIRQSGLASASRCFQQKHLDDMNEAAGGRRPELSATAYGTVLHLALQMLETYHHEGREDALAVAVSTFEHYWNPANIDAVVPGGVDVWLPRQTYGGMLIRGRSNLRDYFELLARDDGKLLALEYSWEVPYVIDGREHVLSGTLDRLALRKYRGKPYLSVEDYKSGKKPTFLRHAVQWTTYCWASTQPQFWDGFVTAGAWDSLAGQFAKNSADLFGIARRGRWIHLAPNGVSIKDAGWRGDADYARLTVALREYVRAHEHGVFPLSLSGSVCQYCQWADGTCGGVPVPDEDEGKP